MALSTIGRTAEDLATTPLPDRLVTAQAGDILRGPAGTQSQPDLGRIALPAPRAYLISALLRCALYLGPLSVAVAAAGPMARVAWPVPALTLLLGWSAAQALTGVGGAVALRVGTVAAARLVAGGFAAVSGFWCALVWVAPQSLLGPDRLLAAVLGLGGLIGLATVAGALVTRAEIAVIRWSVPIWLLAAITVADAWPPAVPGPLLLGVAVVVAAVRAFRPALVRTAPPRPALTPEERRQARCYLIVGAAQAICVALLWRTGPVGATPPAVLPLLAAVPMLEVMIGWHASRHEHVREVSLVTLAGLLPPFVVGVAMAAAAYRLPYQLSRQDGARDLVLSLAGGTLLGGVLAVTLLLAAGGHTGTAAALAAAPPVLSALLTAWPLPGTGPAALPAVVAVLAITYLTGLSAVARTAPAHRRTP